MKGKFITPSPGFVIKTKRMKPDDTMKIFINLCVHNDIDIPGIKKKLNDQGESVEGMNIPMSVGEGHKCTDKSNINCYVYDIIVNTIVLNESINDETGKYRDFICQLCIQYIETKYHEILDKKYKLPKLKYFGSLLNENEIIQCEQQYIQDRSNLPKIEEITPNNISKTNNNKITEIKNKIKPIIINEIEMEYKIYWTQQLSLEDKKLNENESINEEILLNLNDYIDPIESYPINMNSILFLGQINAHNVNLNDFNIEISPYKLHVSFTFILKMTKKNCFFIRSLIASAIDTFIHSFIYDLLGESTWI